MASCVFPSLKKWPLAIHEALSILSESGESGDVRQIEFDLGSPEGGFLPIHLIVDGRRAHLGEVSDSFPVLGELRGWMERCLVADRNGTFHPEIVTLNLANAVFSMFMLHVGWDMYKEPVSLFIIARSDRKHPVICETCSPLETISNLYWNIHDCLRDNSDRFNDPLCWYDVKHYSRLERTQKSDRLLMQLHSSKIEKLSHLVKKNQH